ncbi:MAG: YhcH/YjgK/YiaL family protein [Cellulosilyticaceae bacterium]
MIYDHIKNIDKYRGISQNLDTAITFLEKTDLPHLPLGKIPIDGEAVFANVMYADTRCSEELFFESHERYIDIQMDLEGMECIEMGRSEGCCAKVYDETLDIAFHHVDDSVQCVLGSGYFVVCMTQERHKPGVAVEAPMRIKKCVVKVRI